MILNTLKLSRLNSLDNDLQDFEVRLKTSINKFKYEAESSSMLNNSQPKGSQIKLPKIPTFTGKLEEWGLFKTQFCDLVIENSQLSDSEKLHYLRGALRGDAEIVETSADDFNSLFKALEQRYENKRVIAD
ncbi:uncharacterized protein TNCT_606501 [Trichonephila clavata]|uniref:Uncharacterized protein n=1 Tax=Trichonephila clavata TaxID=2740835 RepID=A0A8X6IKL3_TRICU|nr:uncharacterized protein TNCT_606501 [Trichonephila clavata]